MNNEIYLKLTKEQRDEVFYLLNRLFIFLSQPRYKSTLTFEEFKTELNGSQSFDMIYGILYQEFCKMKEIDERDRREDRYGLLPGVTK